MAGKHLVIIVLVDQRLQLVYKLTGFHR
jgi:hypothetical protein